MKDVEGFAQNTGTGLPRGVFGEAWAQVRWVGDVTANKYSVFQMSV